MAGGRSCRPTRGVGWAKSQKDTHAGTGRITKFFWSQVLRFFIYGSLAMLRTDFLKWVSERVSSYLPLLHEALKPSNGKGFLAILPIQCLAARAKPLKKCSHAVAMNWHVLPATSRAQGSDLIVRVSHL